MNRLSYIVQNKLKEAGWQKKHLEAVEKLKYLAYYDELTGLPNYNYFLDILHQEIARVNKNPNSYLFAILHLDLDRFQKLKYSLGYALSDKLLVAAATRLNECLSQENIVARLRGDEFVILLRDIKSLEKAIEVADCIHNSFSIPFYLDEILISTSVSIGIVVSSFAYQQPQEFLEAADNAMNDAKTKGIGRTSVYAKYMTAASKKRLYLETELQKAIKYQQFQLNYQPIVCLATGKITGFEALLRWNHPELGFISPGDFIPLAEETGLIVPIGQWVISEACHNLSVWQKQLGNDSSLTVNINISSIQLADRHLISYIESVMNRLNLSGKNLKLEITETVLMENPRSAIAVLEELKTRDIQVCIDDFGTGYCSLSYLSSLPIDTLKIDRSFILDKKKKNFDIVKSIICLARNLKLDVVAEGIETEDQLYILKMLKCAHGQGFLFSKAINFHQVMKLLTDEKNLNIII